MDHIHWIPGWEQRPRDTRCARADLVDQGAGVARRKRNFGSKLPVGGYGDQRELHPLPEQGEGEGGQFGCHWGISGTRSAP